MVWYCGRIGLRGLKAFGALKVLTVSTLTLAQGRQGSTQTV